MAIYITNNGSTFNNKNDLIIIFKNDNDSLFIDKKINDDFIFLFNEKQRIIGVNILNYKKYFKEVESGYHLVNEEIKKYLLNNFEEYFNNEMFESFIQVGCVKSINAHPKNEKLKILSVDFGQETKTIITNLSSIQIGNKYLFALSGATIATGLKIINSKILGEESQGMIMSYSSIGISREGVVQCNELDLGQSFRF